MHVRRVGTDDDKALAARAGGDGCLGKGRCVGARRRKRHAKAFARTGFRKIDAEKALEIAGHL